MNRRRLARLVMDVAQRTITPKYAPGRDVLLASVMAKAERVAAGITPKRADWTNADAATVTHREGILEWLQMKQG